MMALYQIQILQKLKFMYTIIFRKLYFLSQKIDFHKFF